MSHREHLPFLDALENRGFTTVSERGLQDQIATALAEAGFRFEREARLSPSDVVDFLVGDVALEVKNRGGRTEVLRQLHRYAGNDRVAHVALATTRWAHANMPAQLQGKPVTVIALYRGCL